MPTIDRADMTLLELLPYREFSICSLLKRRNTDTVFVKASFGRATSLLLYIYNDIFFYFGRCLNRFRFYGNKYGHGN